MVEARADRRRPRSITQAFLLDLLSEQVASWQGDRLAPLTVIDIGGGTGGVATLLAERGHRVTVVDPSPDALAALERRTADSQLSGKITGVLGDANDLSTLVDAGSVDLVICHRVLEVVDSPEQALAAMAAVLRPGGALSLTVSQRHAVVLSQAISGHVGQALQTFEDRGRFDHDQVVGLVEGAGFAVTATQGVGSVASHVAESVLDTEPGAYADLLALERGVCQDPAFRALAPVVHVFATR